MTLQKDNIKKELHTFVLILSCIAFVEFLVLLVFTLDVFVQVFIQIIECVIIISAMIHFNHGYGKRRKPAM